MIGPNSATGQIQGGGSAGVQPHAPTTILETLRKRLGDGVQVFHETGCRTEKYAPAIPKAQLRSAEGASANGLTLDVFAGHGFAGEPAMQRLSHGTEIPHMARGHGGANAERHFHLLRCELE